MAKQTAQAPTPTRTRSKVNNAHDSASLPAAEDQPEVKQSRARQRTRLRLITAAQAVMSSKGVEGATIQEIAEEAELAVGTFYNHFKTKEEIAKAVFARRAEELGEIFDRIGRATDDPAKAIVFIQRTYIERALADPVWGWFVIHAEFSLRQNEETFRERGRNDILRGIQAGRFDCRHCVDSAISITLSTLVAVTRQILEGRAGHDAVFEMLELMLRMYGMPGSEAAALARLPLPDLSALDNV
ncbi:TetR/AcrR family transcriptional regulator [Pseudomonas japonica]|uniref:TetR/AcrR family transcriptional regulator n=1 Tax=Pseudomonas japonica TaxID=256466 RepID=UPI0037F371B0